MKKEIGVLTFHNACNYGAFLQAKALTDVINRYDDTEAYMIDYINKKILNKYSIMGIFDFSKGFKTVAVKLLRIKDIFKRNQIFKKYQNDTFNLIRFDDREKIRGLHKVVVGSDQVWGRHITGRDDTYFLTFVDASKRTAYAASAGCVTEDFPTEDFSNLLREFPYFSVREMDLFLKLSEIGFKDRMTICIDPVFLKDKDQWSDYAGETSSLAKPYMLAFIMGGSRQADYIVERTVELAKKYGCMAVLLGDQERWYKYRNIKHFGVASPREFLNLIRNAQCVLTNSFHATSFSIIFHTPFYTEMNIENSSRIASLLHVAKLENRTMYNGILSTEYTEDVDWISVGESIGYEIKKSYHFIEEHIIG